MTMEITKIYFEAADEAIKELETTDRWADSIAERSMKIAREIAITNSKPSVSKMEYNTQVLWEDLEKAMNNVGIMAWKTIQILKKAKVALLKVQERQKLNNYSYSSNKKEIVVMQLTIDRQRWSKYTGDERFRDLMASTTHVLYKRSDEIYNEMVAINDNSKINNKTKEIELTKLLKTIGIDLKFVN